MLQRIILRRRDVPASRGAREGGAWLSRRAIGGVAEAPLRQGRGRGEDVFRLSALDDERGHPGFLRSRHSGDRFRGRGIGDEAPPQDSKMQ